VSEKEINLKKVMPYLLIGEVYPLVAISTQSSEFEINVCRMRDKVDISVARRHSDKYCKWQRNTGMDFFNGSDQQIDLALQRSIYKLTVFDILECFATQMDSLLPTFMDRMSNVKR
jgi:hypothetical protein